MAVSSSVLMTIAEACKGGIAEILSGGKGEALGTTCSEEATTVVEGIEGIEVSTNSSEFAFLRGGVLLLIGVDTTGG